MTMTLTGRIIIPDSELTGTLKQIRSVGPHTAPEDRNYRDIEHDIKLFNNMVKTCNTVGSVLYQSSIFIQRRFGNLLALEVFVRKHLEKNLELIVKCCCKCGNDITAPLRSVIDGSLIDCGCRTPLPKKYKKHITIFPSEEPTRWTTTVDGIQWFGERYMWFVTLFVRGECVLRQYTASSKEALRIRKEAELKYYGYSDIDKYESVMLYELEQFRRAYIAKRPPKVEGIYYNATEKLWNARLRHDRKLVYNKSFETREEAVKARLGAERRFYEGGMMMRKSYLETQTFTCKKK